MTKNHPSPVHYHDGKFPPETIDWVRLVPLFLFERKLLHSPMFYVNEYLERNRQEYDDRLLAVSRDDDWTGWCEFFLKALTDQAVTNEQKVRESLKPRRGEY